jgi:hypothetical protein
VSVTGGGDAPAIVATGLTKRYGPVTGGDVLPWGAAFLVMLAWAAVFLLAAALVDGRRDVA